MKHKHHIKPKHMGGTNDKENLIELTIEDHAEAHRILYETYGKKEDYIAWMGLSGQLKKKHIIIELSKINGLNVYKNKLGIFAMSEEERNIARFKGGKVSGKQNADSGHCANIAHLGGESSAGMSFWLNTKTNKETRSHKCPGDNWIAGINIQRVNVENLIIHSNNTKGSFWIHNPHTGQSKMVFSKNEIPSGFVKGRKHKPKNIIRTLNSEDIKSEYSGVWFDKSYQRWVFEFKIYGKKSKITHTDYYSLIWARDAIINYYRLNILKSKVDFEDSLSKEYIIDLLKSFREYIKIEKILEGKLKSSRRTRYTEKLNLYKEKYNFIMEKINKIKTES